MKKRILSCLMALALCLTLLPTAALAEEPEGTAQTSSAVGEAADPANGKAKQENQPAVPEQEKQPAAPEQEKQPAEQEEQQEDSAAKQDEAVAAVQAMIDALPDAAELDGMDDEDAMAIYEAFQAACEAYYDALTDEEQRAQLKNTEKLEALSKWFSQSAALAAAARTGETHEHYLCGGTTCNEKGHEQEDTKPPFKPWDKDATTKGGAYYLTSDLNGLTVPSGVNLTLCLNGHSISSSYDGPTIEVKPGATLTLCDCKDAKYDHGITHARNVYGTGVLVGKTVGTKDTVGKNDAVFNMYGGYIYGNSPLAASASMAGSSSGVTVAGGTFNLYGGTIRDNKAYEYSDGGYGGVFVCNQGIFNMSGGTITGNTTFLDGAGVSVGGLAGLHDAYKLSGGTFNMSGGTITGNKAGSSGGGVYVSGASNTSFNISGTAKITGNYTGKSLDIPSVEGTVNNVYLGKYTGGGETRMATIEASGLTAGASIGVTTEKEGQTVATGVSQAAKGCFTSDNSKKYRLQYDNDAQTLTMIAATHTNHHFCGDVNCTNNNHALPGESSWEGVSKLSDIKGAGYYYLTADVEITSTWQPQSGVVLCLNGYDITMKSAVYAIWVKEGYTFTLCDCVGGGKITHTKGVVGYGVYVVGTFNMYGGSISGNSAKNGGGVWLDNGETGTVFNMYGGEITGNTATSSGGGGVYVNRYSTFHMYGGSITDNLNTASGDYGGGVYVSQDGTFTVSGKVNITGNKYQDDTASNVYLPSDKTITVDGKLDSTASIGVTTASTIANESYLAIAKGGSTYTLKEDDLNAFTSDNNTYGKQLLGNSVVFTNGSLHTHAVCNDASCKDHPNELWLPISNESELQAATAGYYYLNNNIELTSIWKPTSGVVLCLNNESITANGSFNAIEVGNGVTFTLTDCGSQRTGTVTHVDATKTGCGVKVLTGGTFKMYDGWITENTVNSNSGGGVYVIGGTFEMYGGNISGNTANYGGGVSVVEGGQFTMSGSASIAGNEANGTSGAFGGGVYVSDSGSTFEMHGGTIGGKSSNDGNTADGNGGGVYMAGGTFTMTGGASITENRAAGNGKGGGGVYVSGGIFNMNGGTIERNTAAATINASGSEGGGVYVEGGTFTMTGGAKISGNTANYGGGVCVTGTAGKFTVSGNVNVTGNHKIKGTNNNVYLCGGKTITIDTLAETARIGITTGISPESTTDKKTQFATGATGDLDYYTTIFTPDEADRGYVVTKDGTDLFLSAHQHSWSYTANGAIITATCENCPLATGGSNAYSGSITIEAPASTLTYDGTGKEARVTKTQWSGDVSISYKVKTGDGENAWGALPENTAAPTNAGTYTANITLTGADRKTATASVEYTIEKAAPTVDNFTFTTPQYLTYNGNAKTAEVKANGVAGMGAITVKYFKDNQPVNEAKEVGEYTVKISVDNTGKNFNATTEDLTKDGWEFAIGKGTQTIHVPTDRTIVKNGREVDISGWATVSGVEGGKTPGTLSYALNGNPIDIALTGNMLKAEPTTTVSTFEIKATAAETNDYKEVSRTFTVTVTNKTPVSISQITMPGWTYGESAKEPEYVKAEGAGEATVTYAVKDSGVFNATPPTNAGEYTVKVQYETNDNIYTGTKDFIIKPKNISGVTINLGPQATYNGNEQGVAISSVMDGTHSLIAGGHDYAIFSGNKATNVGENTLVIEGKGNYTGTARKTWSLNAMEVTLEWGNITDRKWNDGKTVTATVSNKVGSDEVNVTVTGGDQTAVGGSHTATAAGLTGAQAGNYKLPADKEQTYSIGKAAARDLPEITVSQKFNLTTEQSKDIGRAGMPEDAGTLTYAQGSASKAGTVTIDSWSVDTTGKVTYKLSGGVAGATVTLPVTIGSDNYADSTVNVVITLTDKDTPTVTANGITVTYDGQPIPASKITGTANVAGTWEWKSGMAVTNVVDSGNKTVVFKPTDSANYAEVEKTIKVTINKATPTGTPTYTAITTSGKTLTDAALGIGSITPAGGTITWDAGNGTVVAANTAYGWTYMPTDTANYNNLTGTITPYVVSSSSGGSRPSTNPVQTEVSKDPDGSVSLSKTNAAKGDKVTVTVKPDRHYEVDEVIVRDSKGKQLAVKDNGDGTFTFEMPADKVTVEPTFSWVNPFADVADSAYYVDAVEWMLKREVTQGTTETTFSPNLNCTRAQIVTFLWRAAGSPEPKGTVGFADVSAGSYYAKAVAWAIENGITGGTGDGLFSPDATCTRAQSAAFLYRAAGSPAVSGSAGFSDVAADAYYASAVAWAKEHGITDGIGGGLFGSANDCTRAQIAAFLYRCMK